jgi:hypothetical protein
VKKGKIPAAKLPTRCKLPIKFPPFSAKRRARFRFASRLLRFFLEKIARFRAKGKFYASQALQMGFK